MILKIAFWISFFVFGFLPAEPEVLDNSVVTEESIATAETPIVEELSTEMLAAEVFDDMKLTGIIDPAAFTAAYSSMVKYGLTDKGILAIADMSLPSNEERLYLVDIQSRKFIMRTFVAHGTNTGELYAKVFSNKIGSHRTSKGLYKVGQRITSPKHGPALLLHGLEKGLNDKAEVREIIIHKADYVSKEFIQENGHLGRSWGCPAVSEKALPTILRYMPNNGLLYVYGN